MPSSPAIASALLVEPLERRTLLAGTGGAIWTDFELDEDRAYAAAVQSDGKLIAAGTVTTAFGGRDFGLARYNSDGTLDATFGAGGRVTLDLGGSDELTAVALDATGRIVVAGYTDRNVSAGNGNDFALARFDATGLPDATFGTGGAVVRHFVGTDQANAVAVQPDGKLVVVGMINADFGITRFHADGTLDSGGFGSGGFLRTTFGTGTESARGLALQPDGRIVVAGYGKVGSGDDFTVARYTPAGLLDTSFSGDGKHTINFGTAFDGANAAALAPDGTIYLAGRAGGDGAVLRLSSDGTLLPWASGAFAVRPDLGGSVDRFNAIHLAPDGSILFAGGAGDGGAGQDVALVRYTPSHALDDSFAPGGVRVTAVSAAFDEAGAIAVLPDGRVVLVGTAAAGDALPDPSVADTDFLVLGLTDPATPSVADLVVTGVVAPTTAAAGEDLTVTFTVLNRGTGAVDAIALDALYLSTDAAWDVADVRLGTVPWAAGTLDAGGSYTATLAAAAPGVLAGAYHVIVRADVRGQVAEVDEANNALAVPIAITVRALPFDGGAVAGDLAAGRTAIYRVDVASSGRDVAVTLDAAAVPFGSELLVRRDAIPTRTTFDASIPLRDGANRLALTAAPAGTYYVMVRAPSAAGLPYALAAGVAPFAVTDAGYGRGSAAGPVTIQVNGAQFDGSVAASLVDPLTGTAYPAVTIGRESTTRLYATFDLTGVPPRTYDVVLTHSAGQAAIVRGGLEVVHAAAVPATVSVSAPDRVRRDSHFQFTVEWRNDTLGDVPAPLITVGLNVPFGDARDALTRGPGFTFLGTSTEGPAGILRPGQVERRTFWAYSDRADGDYTISVARNGTAPTDPLDWEPLRESITPPGMSDAAFAPVFAALRARVGDTWGDYLRMLATNAAVLPAALGDPRNPLDLIALEVRRAKASIGTSISGTVDLNRSAVPGLSRLLIAKNIENGREFSTTTLNDGTFVFEKVDPGRYKLDGQDVLVRIEPASEVIVHEGHAVAGISLTLSKIPTWGGVVVNVAGQAVANASLRLIDADGTTRGFTTGDNQGSFTITTTAPGQHRLVVDAPGYARTWVGAELVQGPAPQGSLRVTMIAEARATGRVTVGGAPASAVIAFAGLAGAQDSAESMFVADGQGDSFIIERLPAGDYTFLVAGYESSVSTPYTITVQAGHTLDLGTIDLPATQDFEFVLASLTNIASEPTDGVAGDTSSTTAPPVPPPSEQQPYPSPNPGSRTWSDAYDQADNFTILEGWVQIGLNAYLKARYNCAEVSSLWNLYLNSNAQNPAPFQQYVDGSEIVERPDGFRNHPATSHFLDEFMDVAAFDIRKQFEQGILKDSDFGPAGELAVPITQLRVPMSSVRYDELNFGIDAKGNDLSASIPGVLAGGGGEGDWYKDSRELTGYVVVRKTSTTTVEVESRVRMIIWDTIDLDPGDLGKSIEQGITRSLRLLERLNRAHDVTFQVYFTDKPGRVRTVSVPGIGSSNIALPAGVQLPSTGITRHVRRPTSFDPNDITGPAGVGDGNFVGAGSSLGYTIRFENDPVRATAPAQVVRIVQQLDADLDPSTFELGGFLLGDRFVDVPAGRSYFATRIDLTATLGVLVDIEAGIDVATGLASWQFTAIDPLTGEQPLDPLVGLLPPNVVKPQGEGAVTYSVRPRGGAATGTRVDAQARIVFDANAPIDTPAIFHTLDAGAPTSAASVLPARVADPAFAVTWAGVDDAGGSGIGGYDVYVREDDGPYTLWLRGTTLTAAVYTGGRRGHAYAFHTVARDLVGHAEPAPPSPDATTRVNAIPVAVDDGLAVDEDGELVLPAPGVLGNDADADGDALLATVVSGPAHGTLALAPDGSLRYRPDPDWHGTDAFTYRAGDGLAEGGEATVYITVRPVNDAPTVDAVIAPVGGVRGQALRFAASAGDVDGDALTAVWTFSDGSTAPGFDVLHVFSEVGAYTATLTVNDPHGGSVTQVRTVQVDAVQVQGSTLVIGGTAGADAILVGSFDGLGTGVIGVSVDDIQIGAYATPFERIIVHAYGGNDAITIVGAVPGYVFGGTGDDLIKLGSGGGVAVGEAGNDLLVGGSGRDVLIGGRGADRIVGNAGDDVLIAGYTAHDGDGQALSVVLSQWSALDAYTARVSSLRAGLLGTAYVFDDSTEDEIALSADTLTGASGEDWFLYNAFGVGARDRIAGAGSGETRTDI